MPLRPVSATIITYNEEDRIAAAIASLSCCDEVLVIDSESTDRTREIAARCGARVVQRKWEGYSRQKNFAAEQAANDWILSIDADERVSVELSNEILAWKALETAANAFSMPRRVFYFGKWIQHSGWYPDRKIRLYHRRRARWTGDFVHERLSVEGPISELSGDLLHFPYRSWADQMQRADRYIELATREAKPSPMSDSLKLLAGPPAAFLRAFVLRAGFLDGWRGAAIAYSAARYVFLRQFRILR
jgi:glycosyltransferase involved in cell wall biosynthesis